MLVVSHGRLWLQSVLKEGHNGSTKPLADHVTFLTSVCRHATHVYTATARDAGKDAPAVGESNPQLLILHSFW